MNVKPHGAANPAPVSNLPNGLQRLTTGPWALGLATAGYQVFELTLASDLDRRAAAMVKDLQALLAQGVEKPAVVSSHNGQMLLVTERSLESKDPVADIVAKYGQLLAQSAAKSEGEARSKLEQADQKAPRTVEQLERALLSRRTRQTPKGEPTPPWSSIASTVARLSEVGVLVGLVSRTEGLAGLERLSVGLSRGGVVSGTQQAWRDALEAAFASLRNIGPRADRDSRMDREGHSALAAIAKDPLNTSSSR